MYAVQSFKVLTLFTCITILKAQVIISEIMYNLDGSDSPNEFVELYNKSPSDSVDLAGWSLGDKYAIDVLVDSGRGRKLPPEHYGVIVEGDYPLDTGIYTPIIPEGTLIMKVDDSSIGNGLSDSDSLYLIDPGGRTVNSVGWNTSARPGYSLERVRLNRPNTPSNWKISRDSLGTPGKVNSVQPLGIDGHLLPASLHLSKENLSKTDITLLSGAVVNEGLNTLSGEIIISEGANSLGSASIGPLSELDTASFSTDLGPFTLSGIHTFIIQLHVNGDEDTSNNRSSLSLAVQYDWNILRLNEFLARPNNDQIEFIELVSDSTFPLTSWSISDNSRKRQKLPSVPVYAGDYIVIAPDSTLLPLTSEDALYLVPLGSFPSLNNSGDGIYIYDLTGTVIDSLVYTPGDWPVLPEVSTEKLWPEFSSNDPDNWKSAPDSVEMTPGRPNAVLLFETDGALNKNLLNHQPVYPEEFEPFALQAGILNSGLTPFQGVVIVSEKDRQLGEATTSVVAVNDTVWVALDLPGLTSGSHRLNIQLSIAGDSNLDNNRLHDTVNVSFPFNTVRFNEFLPIPNSDQTEFLELQSDASIMLEGWSISDQGSRKMSLPPVTIAPGVFPVIAADSSLLPITGSNSPYYVPQEGFPSLNNTSDGLFLYDMTGKVIDSLKYTRNWPIMSGRSTEKFRPEYLSSDSSRWGLSVSQEGATPGNRNSIYYDAISREGVLLLDPNPFSPDNDGQDDQLFLKYTLPFEEGIVRVEIFDVTGRTIARPFWDRVIPQEGALIWDGKRNNGAVARIGIYTIKFSARSMVNREHWETVKTVVLAKQLK